MSWLRAYKVVKANPVCLYFLMGLMYLVTAPSGRSFAVKEIYETQTYEPIDYIDPPDERLNDSFIVKYTRQGTVSRAFCMSR